MVARPFFEESLALSYPDTARVNRRVRSPLPAGRGRQRENPEMKPGAGKPLRRASAGAPLDFADPDGLRRHLQGADILNNIVGVAVHASEVVLLLAPEHPLGGVETGIGEGGPAVRAVARHSVVEAAVAQQPEVGHPDLPGGRRVVGG